MIERIVHWVKSWRQPVTARPPRLPAVASPSEPYSPWTALNRDELHHFLFATHTGANLLRHFYAAQAANAIKGCRLSVEQGQANASASAHGFGEAIEWMLSMSKVDVQPEQTEDEIRQYAEGLP